MEGRGGFVDAGAVVDAAAFGVVGAEEDAVDAEHGRRRGAERAGLEGDDEGAAGEAGGAEFGGGCAEGEDLGVGGGVVSFLGAVAGAREDGAVGGEDDGADGDLAAGGGGAGFVEGGVHGRGLPGLGHFA